jgi:ubiquinone biosynthesis protein UbiJ
MDALQKLVETVMAGANGPWPVIALAVLGGYVILWKFGNQILGLLQQTHAEARNISESIVTNHGSKNLGDAVDRLTEQVGAIHERLDKLENKEA